MKPLSLAIAIGCLAVSLLPAQNGSPTPMPIAQPVYTQLKAFLNLTDAQVQSLIQILASGDPQFCAACRCVISRFSAFRDVTSRSR